MSNDQNQEENPVLKGLMDNYVLVTADLNILRIVNPKNQCEQMLSWLDAAEKWDYKNPYFVYDDNYISQTITRLDPLKRLKSEIMGVDVSSFSPGDRAVVEILKNRTDGAIATIEFAELMLAKKRWCGRRGLAQKIRSAVKAHSYACQRIYFTNEGSTR